MPDVGTRALVLAEQKVWVSFILTCLVHKCLLYTSTCTVTSLPFVLWDTAFFWINRYFTFIWQSCGPGPEHLVQLDLYNLFLKKKKSARNKTQKLKVIWVSTIDNFNSSVYPSRFFCAQTALCMCLFYIISKTKMGSHCKSLWCLLLLILSLSCGIFPREYISIYVMIHLIEFD